MTMISAGIIFRKNLIFSEDFSCYDHPIPGTPTVSRYKNQTSQAGRTFNLCPNLRGVNKS